MKNNIALVFSHLLWLNARRMKSRLFWRLMLVIVNGMALYAAVFPLSLSHFQYIVALAALSNLLFISLRTGTDQESINLLRSLGCSRGFIAADHLMEILLEVLAAIILILPLAFMTKSLPRFGGAALTQLVLVLAATPLLSLITLSRLEKQKKER